MIQLILVAENHGIGRRIVDDKYNVALRKLGLGERRDPVKDVAQTDKLHPRLFRPRKIQEFPDQPLDPSHLVNDIAEQALVGRGQAGL